MDYSLLPILALMGLACALLGGLFGALCVAPFEENGPRAVRRQMLIATVIAISIPLVPALIFGTEIYTDRWNGPMFSINFGATALAFLAVGLSLGFTAERRARAHLAMVPNVKPFVLKNFKLLDGDEDGVLSAGDLSHAEKEKFFSDANDLAVLAFLRGNIGSIGHGVGSYRTYNAATKTTSSHTVSVISQRDVDNYAEREFAKYAGWRT